MQRVLTRYLSTRLFHSTRKTGLIYRTAEDVGENILSSDGFESRHYLLRRDGLGFSIDQTIIFKDKPLFMHYKNHVQAVFITKGQGKLEVVDKKENQGTGRILQLEPGTMYALEQQESHFVTAESDELHAICVFNPPLTGKESHNEEGEFAAIDNDGQVYEEYDTSIVERLFEPPQSLKSGTCRMKDHPLF